MDIVSLPIEYNRKEIESKYRLVVIASQRARELSLGAKPRIQTKAGKVTSTAIIEAIGGEIEFLKGEEAVAARQKSGRIDYKKLMEEKRRPITDLSELEKDLKVYLHEKGATEKALDELFTDTEEGTEAEESAE